MRAVLDPNVLIAALLSPTGSPAQILDRWLGGAFELVVSELLLDELTRTLAYPKLRTRIAAGDAEAFTTLLRSHGILAADPPSGVHRSADAADDYLLALAASTQAVLVSGDGHLLELAHTLPIVTPRAFLETLDV